MFKSTYESIRLSSDYVDMQMVLKSGQAMRALNEYDERKRKLSAMFADNLIRRGATRSPFAGRPLKKCQKMDSSIYNSPGIFGSDIRHAAIYPQLHPPMPRVHRTPVNAHRSTSTTTRRCKSYDKRTSFEDERGSDIRRAEIVPQSPHTPRAYRNPVNANRSTSTTTTEDKAYPRH